MKRFVFCLLISFYVIASFAQQPVLETKWGQPTGFVNAVEKDTVNNIVYVGGYFKYVGAGKAYNCIIDGSTGEVDQHFENANMYVNTSISDGNGGWYIAGQFTKVGDSLRNGFAHLNAEGKVDKFSASGFAGIKALYKAGNTLFMAGGFTKINNQTRNHLAAFDLVTGTLLDWAPNANGSFIDKIESDGNNLYVSGDFTTIAGVTRTRLAAIDMITGAATNWNPAPNQQISDLKIHEGILYVSGGFTKIANTNRNYISAFNLATGNLITSFEVYLNSPVLSIAIKDNIIYMGSVYTGTGSRTLTAANIQTGQFTQWNPNVNGTVSCIGINKDTLIVAGDFTSINNTTVKYLASFDLMSGNLKNWNPNPTTVMYDPGQDWGNSINSIVCVNNKISLTGTFTSINGVYRNNIVALDGNTGKPTNWTADVDYEIFDIAVTGDVVYIAGSFLNVKSLQRNFIAALDRVTGNPTSWSCNDFNTFGAPRCLVATKDVLYVGGDFTTAGGQARNYLVALDAVTGKATAWNPNVNAIVNDMILKSNTLYVGGSFTKIGIDERKYLAAIDVQTGNATSWNPGVTGSYVSSININKNNLYATGSFSALSGQPRNGIGAVTLTDGAATDWASVYKDIAYVAVKNSKAYVMSIYSIFDNKFPSTVASLDSRSAAITAWKPKNISSGTSLKIFQNRLYVTGRAYYSTQTLINFYVYTLPCYEPVLTGISSTTTSICEGDENTVELTVESGNLNDATDWQWYEGNCNTTLIGTGAAISVSPETTRTYFVRAEGGCIEPMDCKDITISVNDPAHCITTGVFNQPAVSVAIYPNPNNGSCIIAASTGKNYTLVNALGKSIMQIELNSGNDYKKTIEHLENGMYFLYELNTENKSYQKIIVAK